MAGIRSRLGVNAAITIGAVTCAMIARSVIDYWLDEHINYGTFYLAVMISAVYCGAWWGIFSVILSTCLAVLAIRPYFYPAIQEPGDSAGLIIFLAVSAGIVWLGDRVRQHGRLAEEAARERQRLLVRERAAREEAERLNHIKDSFLAAVSHELRTPLQSILGWAELLRDCKMSDEEVTLAIDSIERGVRMQSQLISDLLDLSRIGMGKLQLDVRPIAASEALRAAVQTVLPAAKAKNVQLEVQCHGMGSVLGDADRLQQVIWNLLSNAIKFTPAEGLVRASLKQDGETVSIAVADTGEGIDAEFLPRVFDRFQQAGDKRRREGLGLGLAIVKELVELHGGTVEAHSEGKGRGSEFKVLLPKHRPSAVSVEVATARARAKVTSQAALAGKQVLVIDDDADARDVLKNVLGGYGAEVLTAQSADEANGLLRSYRPDVVTCDLDMPDADGFEFMRRLRSEGRPDAAHPPVVALTACGSDADRKKVLASGFERHLVKPVGPQELAGTLAEVTKSPRLPR